MKCPEGEGVKGTVGPPGPSRTARSADASTGRRPMSSWPLAAQVTDPATCHFWGYLRPAGESIDRRIRGSRRMAFMMGSCLKLCTTEMRLLLEQVFEKEAHTGGMAGGMSTRRGVPLRDRPVNLGDGKGQDVAHGRGQRHCWVHGLPEDPGPHPGLIQAWRRGSDEWSALVIFIVTGEPDQDVTTIQRWVPASWLRPA